MVKINLHEDIESKITQYLSDEDEADILITFIEDIAKGISSAAKDLESNIEDLLDEQEV